MAAPVHYEMVNAITGDTDAHGRPIDTACLRAITPKYTICYTKE
jgi:hypothetical protein